MAGGAIAEIIAGAVSGLNDIAVSHWNIKNQKQQQDYQKALQQTIFEREDTALQRRMEDAKNAGLNPYMVANGTGSNAGSVVSTVTPQMEKTNALGKMLDSVMASQQIKQVKEQTKKLEAETDIAKANSTMANLEKNLAKINYGYLTGNFNGNSYFNGSDTRIEDMPFYKQLEYQMQNQKNSADMLQKDNQFYTADKIAEYAGTVGQLFNYGFNSYGTYKKYSK